MQDSHTTAKQSKTRAAQHSRTKIAYGVLTTFTAALLTLTGCTAAPNGTSTDGPSTTSTANEKTTAPSTKAPPSLMVEAVYKPASAEGPAQNVPVPVLPDRAKEFSKEGLIAFAEYWYETLGYVYETGDSGHMMAVTEPGCKTCAFINEPVSSWYQEGGWIAGGQMTVIQSTSPFVETPDGAYQAMLLVRQAKVTYYSRDGTQSTELPQAIAKTNLVEASYSSDGWTAKSVEILKRG